MVQLALRLTFLVGVLAVLNGVQALTLPSSLSARQNAPQPPNGTIELHHDPTSSSWYLLVSLDPSNYTNTFGSRTILGQHNPHSTVTLYFSVSGTSEAAYGNPNITDYTIHSTPVAFEHHINDPLQKVVVYNAAEQYYPEGQPIFFDMTVDGVPAGAVSGGPDGVSATGFTADLNKPLNVTGIFTIHY